MAEYTVTDMKQTTQFDKDMVAIQVYEFTFNVGEFGPFTVSIPVEGYTASKGRDLLSTKAQEISSTLGI